MKPTQSGSNQPPYCPYAYLDTPDIGLVSKKPFWAVFTLNTGGKNNNCEITNQKLTNYLNKKVENDE